MATNCVTITTRIQKRPIIRMLLLVAVYLRIIAPETALRLYNRALWSGACWRIGNGQWRRLGPAPALAFDE